MQKLTLVALKHIDLSGVRVDWQLMAMRDVMQGDENNPKVPTRREQPQSADETRTTPKCRRDEDNPKVPTRREQPQSADGKQLSAAVADEQPRRPNKHQLSITGLSDIKFTRSSERWFPSHVWNDMIQYANS